MSSHNQASSSSNTSNPELKNALTLLMSAKLESKTQNNDRSNSVILPISASSSSSNKRFEIPIDPILWTKLREKARHASSIPTNPSKKISSSSAESISLQAYHTLADYVPWWERPENKDLPWPHDWKPGDSLKPYEKDKQFLRLILGENKGQCILGRDVASGVSDVDRYQLFQRLVPIPTLDPQIRPDSEKRLISLLFDSNGNQGQGLLSPHVDHIFPASYGGRTILPNLQLLHWTSNMAKSAHSAALPSHALMHPFSKRPFSTARFITFDDIQELRSKSKQSVDSETLIHFTLSIFLSERLVDAIVSEHKEEQTSEVMTLLASPKSAILEAIVAGLGGKSATSRILHARDSIHSHCQEIINSPPNKQPKSKLELSEHILMALKPAGRKSAFIDSKTIDMDQVMKKLEECSIRAAAEKKQTKREVQCLTMATTFFGNSSWFDYLIIKPLCHLGMSWELTWDAAKNRFKEKEDDDEQEDEEDEDGLNFFAVLSNELIKQLDSALSQSEGELTPYQQEENALALLMGRMSRSQVDSYEELLETGGSKDPDQKHLIGICAGRILESIKDGFKHFDEMENAYPGYGPLVQVLRSIMAHRFRALRISAF